MIVTTIYYIGMDVEEIIDMLNIILNNFKVRVLNQLTLHSS